MDSKSKAIALKVAVMGDWGGWAKACGLVDKCDGGRFGLRSRGGVCAKCVALK